MSNISKLESLISDIDSEVEDLENKLEDTLLSAWDDISEYPSSDITRICEEFKRDLRLTVRSGVTGIVEEAEEAKEDEVLNDSNYIRVKVDNLADRMKLEHFLTTELYPNLNEQRGRLFGVEGI